MYALGKYITGCMHYMHWIPLGTPMKLLWIKLHPKVHFPL